mgnify:CR=1 FL=1
MKTIHCSGTRVLRGFTALALFTLAQEAFASTIVTFNNSGDFNAQFSPDNQYTEASSGGLNNSRAIVLATNNPTSFDGPASESVDFSVEGAKMTVGTFFNLSSFPTTTNATAEIIRLGLTAGGSGNFADLPYATFRRTSPDDSDFQLQLRGTTAGPIFTLSTDTWYYFEATFTNAVAPDTVHHDMAIYNATNSGGIGSLVNQLSGDVSGGIYESSFSTLVGGFKVEQGLDNGADGVMDNFYVDNTGTSQIPEPSSIFLLFIASSCMVIALNRK